MVRKIVHLRFLAPDGKRGETDKPIIQSIPSPRSEPFKRWLVEMGYEWVQEIEDPEFEIKRTGAIYKAKV